MGGLAQCQLGNTRSHLEGAPECTPLNLPVKKSFLFAGQWGRFGHHLCQTGV